ncbi:hypothetical protein TcYC6_0074510 [Trypanosoma cruzi]|nr:hypothetical protein TcYC6_0074510 [Trypanosoma cruzi]
MILNYGRSLLHPSLHSHLDPLRYYTTPPRQMMPLWRSIVQQLAGSHAHRAECLAIENGFRHLIPPRLETSQLPTQIPVETDSLSAIEALRVAH